MYIWYQMLSSSLDTLLKVSKTTYPKEIFAYDCVTLYSNSLCKVESLYLSMMKKWELQQKMARPLKKGTFFAASTYTAIFLILNLNSNFRTM